MSSEVPRGNPPMSYEEEVTVRLAEYGALRAEILKRLEVNFQLASLVVVAAGTLLFAGLQSTDRRVGAVLVLSYPFLAFLVAGVWGHSNRRLAQLGSYIRAHIEPTFGKDAQGLPRMGWDRHQAASRVTPRLYLIAMSWIFAGTELFLIVIAILVMKVDPFGILDSVMDPTPPPLADAVLSTLFVFAVLSFAATFYATRRGARIVQAA